MAPPKQAKRELTRARIARDAALNSIKNVHILSMSASRDPQNSELFLARYSTLVRSISNFEAEQHIVMTMLVDLDRADEFNDTDRPVTELMEELQGEIEVVYRSCQQVITKATASCENQSYTTSNRSLILPKIELPKFDGNALRWCAFRDMFISLIHENNSISDIEKFHYLISGVSGTAQNIVKSLPLTADNYTIAWRALIDRFDNQRLLATAYLDKLFTFECLQRESVSSLMSFINTFRENVAAIKALGVEDLSGFLLFYIGARVLDPDTRLLFESSLPPNKIPNLDAMLDFAAQRCKILENVGSSKITEPRGSNSSKGNKGKRLPVKSSFAAITAPSKKYTCHCCERDHLLYRCHIFKRKPVTERREFVSSKKLCFICLQGDHFVGACTATYLCKLCNGRHNTLLHTDTVVNRSTASTSSEVSKKSESSASEPQFVGAVQSEMRVVLATAKIRIRDHTGEFATVRVLLDSGSQISAITKDCANRLGLPRHKQKMEIFGLAQQPVKTVHGLTGFNFVPLLSNSHSFTANNVVILSKITDLMPNNTLPCTVRERYGHLTLADPEFDVPGSIDMLIGGDLYPFLLQHRSDIIHCPGLPSALETHLGWVVIGVLDEATMSAGVSLAVTTLPTLHDMISQFWATEEPEISTHFTTDDDKCESWFKRIVKRDVSGRFSVALPFKSEIMTPSNDMDRLRDARSVGLGSSRALALSRLYNLERRLNKDAELYKAYREFMNEYLALGHMQAATQPGEYFIPHHAVVKRSDQDLKIRVVFDASALSSSGLSLNDCLMAGPKLQLDISDILFRTRFQKYLVIADIAKMYRQIQIREPDRVFQHILWRNSPHEEVKEFELCTVTYGVNAAPFLAIRCLRQLNEENGPEYPLARNLLVTNTYVDDIIAGADNIETLLELQKQLIALLDRGCFELKKWASNCTAALDTIAMEDRVSAPSFGPSDVQAVKVLGVYWDPQEDIYGYRSTISEEPPTKRSILSVIARLYDPIGYLGPSIFWAKCVMQMLWCQKLDWDVPAPSEISDRWKHFLAGLSSLEFLRVPRYIDIRRAKDVQLIGFSDASTKGYAATVYLWALDHQGTVTINFITCKTKVAPLKSSQTDSSLTIPKLELCAAVLLAQLLSHKLHILRDIVSISHVRAFSDSTIVLSWLAAEPKDFKIFVTNRILKIKSLLPQCEWAHVRSKSNAADPASRGLLPQELVDCNLHSDGPDFLRHLAHQWPVQTTADVRPDQLPEYKSKANQVLLVQNFRDQEGEVFIKRFSGLRKMQRVLTYCHRFADKARRRPTTNGPASWRECEDVLLKLVKHTQAVYFPDLSKQLRNPNLIVTPNTLAQLAPFMDEQGVIRVGGRLKNSLLSLDAKHPMLLPKSAHLTNLIIRHYHLNTLHGGTRLIMSLIQRRFWIVSGRAAIRQIIFKCIPCTKNKAVTPQPAMADLPSARVQSHRPFTNVGMDYGGPFTIKESRTRNFKTYKAYLALFICLSTKAVHLEVVSDLTTEAFLAALDRFTARRGIPFRIQSDCGTNYVGAARQLKSMFRNAAVQDMLHSRVPCEWNFNPPAAPHFGGIWEAAIKSTKLHLKRVMGTQIYTFEEFMTLTTRVEGILNSRPLVAMSSDPNDLCALTPGHFLIGQPILALPENDFRGTPTNRLRRWQMIKQAFQSFWTRWSREYLHTLQSRQKWYLSNPNLNVGDMVIVHSPSQPPLAWRLGRVSEVHPGSDGIVRVATVITADGKLTRPVVKLVKLPTEC